MYLWYLRPCRRYFKFEYLAYNPSGFSSSNKDSTQVAQTKSGSVDDESESSTHTISHVHPPLIATEVADTSFVHHNWNSAASQANLRFLAARRPHVEQQFKDKIREAFRRELAPSPEATSALVDENQGISEERAEEHHSEPVDSEMGGPMHVDEHPGQYIYTNLINVAHRLFHSTWR